MFRAESMWGDLASGMTNKRHPAASMLLSAADKETVAMDEVYQAQAPGQGRGAGVSSVRVGGIVAGDVEGGEDGRSCSAGASVHEEGGYESDEGDHVDLGGENVCVAVIESGQRIYKFEEQDEVALLVSHHAEFCPGFRALREVFLHEVMVGRWDAGGRVTAAQIRSHNGHFTCVSSAISAAVDAFACWGVSEWESGRLTDAEQGLTRHVWSQCMQFPGGVVINGVLFKAGDWVISRPDAEDIRVLPGAGHEHADAGRPRLGPPKKLWAGCIRCVLKHGLGGQKQEELLDVEWHESGSGEGGSRADVSPFDVGLQCPQLKQQVFRFDRYAKATAVLPLRVVARPHPLRPRTLVLLRRSFQQLSAVKMPVPWPHAWVPGPSQH